MAKLMREGADVVMAMIITGAASGIGRATAGLAAVRGSQLLLVDRDPAGLDAAAELCRSAGARVLALETDLSTVTAGTEIVDAAVTEFGGVRAVISNAGVLRSAPLSQLDPAEFDLSMAVNVRATWLLAKAAYPYLRVSRGSVTATASLAATHPTPNSGAYSSSKAALVMLLRQLSVEWGPDGIRCNCVSPGPTLSGMTRSVFGDERDAAQRENRTLRESHIPLGRVADAEDIARALLFLASDDARHITGVDLIVDGGLGGSLMRAVGGGSGHPQAGAPPADARRVGP